MSDETDNGQLTEQKIIVGHITGVYGVKGWIKVFSNTEPREGIKDYNPWYLKTKTDSHWRKIQVESARRHGKTVVAKIAGIDDREEAMLLSGQEIAIAASQMKPLGKDEYYWRDLIGLRVINQQDIELGVVKELMETGANDVLVVESAEGKQHLIPWTLGHAIIGVDVEARCIEVDWDTAWMEQD